MKLKLLKIQTTLAYVENPYKLAELSTRRYSNIKAKIIDGMIITTIENPLPFTKIYFVQYAPIIDYKISPAISDNFNKTYNTVITYKGDNDNYQVFCKLSFWQRQGLYLMMGDHIILNSGNFKWLVGTVLTIVFFMYQAKQNDKLVQANKDITSLKDSLNKYQNLAIHKTK
jgi:hypothetical protein